MVKNPANIFITTSRLKLREYQIADFEGVHAYACDSETVRFMTWGPNTPEETRNFIELAVSQQTVVSRTDYYLVVTLRGSDEIIGGCGLHIRSPAHGGAEVGYCFNKRFWGQGYATETLGALLKYGFEVLHLHRIIATCDARNTGSERVMQKNGLRQEAHFREALWQKGEWRDSLLYAILESEWKNKH